MSVTSKSKGQRRGLVSGLAFALAFALVLTSGPAAFAGKYDKKLEKDLVKAFNACAALPANASPSDAAITAVKGAIKEFGATDNDKAVKFLLNISLQEMTSPAADVAVFEAVKDSLAAMTDTGSRKEMATTFKKGSKRWQLQVVLAEVFADMSDDDSLFALCEVLKDKKADERVLGQITRSLAKRKDKRSVRALIDAFGRWKDRAGVTFKAIKDSLYEITGQNFDDVEDWESFWDPREATFDPKTAPKEPIGGTVERKKPKLFGSEVVSTRVVVIIDVSGSMAIKDPGVELPEEADEVEGGPGSRERDEKKKKPDPAAPPPYSGPSLKPGDADYNKLPDSRQRIERAKKQLSRLVNAFTGDARFNVVQFSTGAKAWKDKVLMPANPTNKVEAIKFIETLKANGVTEAYEGLALAFACAEADTVYFISDGAPTGKDGNPLPEPEWRAIIDKVTAMNKFRKVKVNSIGLQGSYPPFMKALAEATGGEYKQVD